jgi:hypothetical protein
MHIAYLPLDDRPLNYTAAVHADCISPRRILVPPRGIVGSRNRPAPIKELSEWLGEHCGFSDSAVISLDALLYGGLVQGRTAGEDAARADECERLLRVVSGRAAWLGAFIVWKRVWGNIFDEAGLSRAQEWMQLSPTMAAQQEASGLNALGFLEKAAAGDLRIEGLEETESRDFAQARQNQLRTALRMADLCGTLGVHLHIAVEDCVPGGWQEAELAHLRAEYPTRALTIADGGDEAGAALLAGALRGDGEAQPLRVAADMSLDGVAPYESRTVAENLEVLASLADAEVVDATQDHSVHIQGTPAPGDPYIELTGGDMDAPELRAVVERIQPLKRLDANEVVINLTATNGINPTLFDEFLQAEELPGATVQCNTVSNRIGHGLLAGRLLAAAGPNAALARTVVTGYLEDLVYNAYLRTKLIGDYGGLEPDAAEVAAAETKLARMATEIARRKFDGAELGGGRMAVKAVKASLPWRRWFEAEFEAEAELDGA